MRLNLPSGFERVFSPQVVWGRLHIAPPERAEAGFVPRNRAAWLQNVGAARTARTAHA
jgi:hypothetical protein